MERPAIELAIWEAWMYSRYLKPGHWVKFPGDCLFLNRKSLNQNKTPEIFHIHLSHCFTFRLSNKHRSLSRLLLLVHTSLDVIITPVTVFRMSFTSSLDRFLSLVLFLYLQTLRQRQLMLHNFARPRVS